MSAGNSTTPTPNKTTHDYSVTLNGIKWTALATKPKSKSDPAPIPTFITDGETKDNGTINDDTTTVTITGTVANGGQALKYKYTNGENNAPNLDATNNNSQQLPSNITMIKIVLKKA